MLWDFKELVRSVKFFSEPKGMSHERSKKKFTTLSECVRVCLNMNWHQYEGLEHPPTGATGGQSFILGPISLLFWHFLVQFRENAFFTKLEMSSSNKRYFRRKPTTLATRKSKKFAKSLIFRRDRSRWVCGSTLFQDLSRNRPTGVRKMPSFARSIL